MINIENVNNLFEGILQGDELTTKKLKSYGFKAHDLTYFVKTGKLTRVKRGHYILTNRKDLEHYQEKNAELFDVKELILDSLVDNNWENVLKLIPRLLQEKDEELRADNLFIIFLLGLTGQVPASYLQVVNKLKYIDMRVPHDSKRVKNIQNHNKFRYNVVNLNFPEALKFLNALHFDNDLEKAVYKNLIKEAGEEYNFGIRKIFELVNSKNYGELIVFLMKIQTGRVLTKLENGLLKIAKDIVRMELLEEIPISYPRDDLGLMGLIKHGCYEDALTNLINSGDSFRKKVLYLALQDINEKIAYLKAKNDNKSRLRNNRLESLVSLIENGFSIEDAGARLGYNESQIMIVYLEYAKRYYMRRNFLIGDEYLNYVQNKGNLSSYVEAFLIDVLEFRSQILGKKNENSILIRTLDKNVIDT